MSLQLLWDQIARQDAWEWIGLISGCIYVILAAYEKPSCWWFGILSAACIAWKSFTDYFLIADGVLQIFYIGIGVVGLVQWRRGQSQQTLKPVVTSSAFYHGVAIALCLVLSWPVSIGLVHYAEARYGYMDTVLTLLSVWSTLLLIRKDLHNWIYWIVIDILYVILYWKSDGILFALLFLIYTGISIWGFYRWRRHLRAGIAGELLQG